MSILLSFSTLGCHEWSWLKILDHAVTWGYDGVELRFINGIKELPLSPEFSATQINASRRELEKRNLKLSCVDSSLSLLKSDDASLEQARKCIDIAQGLGAPNIRIFGGNTPEGKSRQEALDSGAHHWKGLAEYGYSRGVSVLLETHDSFCDSKSICELLGRVNHPGAGVLWDVHHPWRFASESCADFWRALGPSIRHLHVKDSHGTREKYTYCLCGDGDIPIREALHLLRREAWSGWVSLEWELAWHPKLAAPEIAMPNYSQKLREYLSQHIPR